MQNEILKRLCEERKLKIKGGLYHKTQVAFAFDSNKIEGSTLSHEQTRMIYETKTIGGAGASARLDDAIHADNHFRCFDYILDTIDKPLSTQIIKELHRILKSGTDDSKIEWFRVGDWKTKPNEVGGMRTTAPKDVEAEIEKLLTWYVGVASTSPRAPTFENLIEFHWRFECIHPFQDGNGRVGRLILFRECLRAGIVPFIIEGDKRDYYYRGLREFKSEPGYLIDTCKAAQDVYREWARYFDISVK